MRTILGSLLVLATVLAGVSSASATSWSYGYSKPGVWKSHGARAFFDQQRKHGN